MTMIGIYKPFLGYHCWIHKAFDIKHGYGYHVQIYDKDSNVYYGFSKNKFTAVKEALKKIK